VSEGSTEQLVRDLARDVTPVRPIPRLRSVMTGVVAAWAIAVAGLLIDTAPSLDFVRGAAWGDPRFVAVLTGLGLIAVGATLAALAGAVPGRENVASACGGVALLGIALAAGGGLWAVVTVGVSPGEPALASGLACMSRAGVLALIPVGVASLFLARGFAQHPLVSAGFAVTGTVALGGLVVHVGCRVGGALHVLLSHALAPLLLGFALAIPIGLLVRRWGRRT
jgi:hypothetical protein